MVDKVVTVTTVKIVSRSFSLLSGKRGGNRQRRRRAANCRRPANQHAESTRTALQAGNRQAGEDGNRHGGQKFHDRGGAKRQHVAGGDPEAKQRHAHLQHRLGGETNAGRGLLAFREKIERNADEQRQKHDRSAVGIGNETGSGGDEKSCAGSGQKNSGAGKETIGLGDRDHGYSVPDMLAPFSFRVCNQCRSRCLRPRPRQSGQNSRPLGSGILRTRSISR